MDNRLNKYTFLLFGVFLLISIAFYVSLDLVKSGNNLSGTGNVMFNPEEGNFDFGFSKIILSLAFAFLMTGFLLWVRSLISKNSYLGAIIGLIGSAIVGYGFSLRYWGPYTLTFMIVTGLIVLCYLGMSFWKYKKSDKYGEDEFE